MEDRLQKTLVTNIQKFSVQDGPGIRTTVFVKGCPLRCLWCHNPETQLTRQELAYRPNLCIGCGQCTLVCERGGHTISEEGHFFDRTDCVACGKCTEVCSGALELIGKHMTVEEVLRVVMQDKAFYDHSGGGMTISGGEPMSNFPFTGALLREAKRLGLNTAMETCGMGSREHFLEVIPVTDLFLFDYKETNPEKHKEFTEVSQDVILSNLALLDDRGANVILRCPIIPGCNDREEHFAGIAQTANRFACIQEVQIEPYHPLGESKAESVGHEYVLKGLSFPEKETVQSWLDSISKDCVKKVIKA